jgi:hypothetical protein
MKWKGVVPLKDYDPEQASLCEEAWVEGSGVMEERDIRKWMWDKRKVLEGSLLVVAKQDEDSWVLAACK